MVHLLRGKSIPVNVTSIVPDLWILLVEQSLVDGFPLINIRHSSERSITLVESIDWSRNSRPSLIISITLHRLLISKELLLCGILLNLILIVFVYILKGRLLHIEELLDRSSQLIYLIGLSFLCFLNWIKELLCNCMQVCVVFYSFVSWLYDLLEYLLRGCS